MPVTDGTGDELLSSTYWNVLVGPGPLDCPSFTVTITCAGPAPSCGLGASAGTVSDAGGNVAVIDVPLLTVNWPAGTCQVPTCIPATFLKPVPVIVT